MRHTSHMLLSSFIADVPPDTIAAVAGEESSTWPVVVAVVAGVALGLVAIGAIMRKRKAAANS